jgi:insulysin
VSVSHYCFHSPCYITSQLAEPSFDQLRTKEQLGYIVNTATTSIGKELYVRIIVQSNSRDAHFLDQRVEAFLLQYRETLAAMTPEELQTNVTAVTEQLREKPKNLDEEASRLWEEVDSGLYLFARKELLASYLQCGAGGTGLELAEVLAFFDRHLAAGSPRRTKFCSEFYGQGHKYPRRGSVEPNTTLLREAAVFKRAMPLKAILSVDASKFAADSL